MTTMLDLTSAVVGRGTSPEHGIGFEPAARACRMILVQSLNAELDAQSERWKNADSRLQELGMDEGVGQVDLEHVPLANFHEGPHKSLIEAPPEAFPNVSVMAYMTVPAASQFGDQVDSSDITLFVEAMAKSGPVPEGLEVAHESIVHRRIQRMTEAITLVIARDPMLLGTVHAMKVPPRGGIGNSTWVKPRSKGAGDRFLWQGSRFQYTLTRHHVTF